MIMTDDPPPGTIGAIASEYAAYCARVADAIAGQAGAIEELIELMERADGIHCYGFGRSGHAAASLAVRLRHFQRIIPDAWWVGDQVRNPFEPGQLLVSFSREGRRFEFERLVGFARDNHLECAFVTAEPAIEHAGRLARDREVVIGLPPMDPELLVPATVYGGGDFELAAYLFQEALATRIGLRCAIPPSDVRKNHVD
jgi:D-arabinose 5-phosphate isomerase GutQ